MAFTWVTRNLYMQNLHLFVIATVYLGTNQKADPTGHSWRLLVMSTIIMMGSKKLTLACATMESSKTERPTTLYEIKYVQVQVCASLTICLL